MNAEGRATIPKMAQTAPVELIVFSDYV